MEDSGALLSPTETCETKMVAFQMTSPSPRDREMENHTLRTLGARFLFASYKGHRLILGGES